MNLSAYRQAFSESHHSPGIRKMRSILGTAKPITDFCVPVNIGFPPVEFMDQLHAELADRLKYYPSEPAALREKFAAFLNLSPANVLAGNGSTELFYNLLSALGKKRRLMTCVPTFGRWTDAPREMGHLVIGCPRREENGYAIDPEEACLLANEHRIDSVIISNPNNPTGHLMEREELVALIQRLRANVPSLELVIVDESFLDFSPRREQATLLNDVDELEDVLVLKSLGKSFGLHGTRMGVVVAASSLIKRIEATVPFWNVNGVAECVIDLMPSFMPQFRQSLDETIRSTQAMREELMQLGGATVSATDANFVYVKMDEDVDPVALRDHLLVKHSLFVRSCGNKEAASARHFRLATRPLHEVKNLVEAIRAFGV